VGSLPAEFEPHVEQPLLYVLQKHKAGTAVSADAGKRKKQKPTSCYQDRERDINLASGNSTDPLRETLWLPRHETDSVNNFKAQLASTLTTACSKFTP
jgi:hypothetical protein